MYCIVLNGMIWDITILKYVTFMGIKLKCFGIKIMWHLAAPDPGLLLFMVCTYYAGIAVAQWLRCCATNRKDAGSIPAGAIGIFTDIKSFRSHYGFGVDSASNINEYQEYFMGVKAAGA